MRTPCVSVIIPVYNQADTIRETIFSVLNQSFNDVEILIIDDGSEQDIKKMINDINSKKITYYRLPHRNANVARNFGIKKAYGKYIAMLDADDYWKENHLEDCLEILVSRQADGLYGSLIIKNTFSGQQIVFEAEYPQSNESMINYLLRTGYGAQTSTLFMTATSAKDILWDEALYRHQDYDFVVRYNIKYRFVVKQKPTVIYRLRPLTAQIDFYSCIRLLEEHKETVEPLVYIKYCLKMLSLAKKQEKIGL